MAFSSHALNIDPSIVHLSEDLKRRHVGRVFRLGVLQQQLLSQRQRGSQLKCWMVVDLEAAFMVDVISAVSPGFKFLHANRRVEQAQRRRSSARG